MTSSVYGLGENIPFLRPRDMTAFLYTRVSHKLSDKSGLSHEEQMRQNESYAITVIPEIEKVRIYDAAISAWSKTFAMRPGGRRILNEAVPGDHLICYSIDRMCRSLRDFCNVMHYFDKAGINVHFVNNQINTTTASGKLQASILAAMAQYSSDITSERTKEALLIKRLTGSDPKSHKEKHLWAKTNLRVNTQPIESRPHGATRLYERVSSDRQYTSGLGLEHQTVANAKYAEALSGAKAQVYSDPAISAFSVPFAKRPAGKKLLEDLQPGDDVVFYRLDRGWRSTIDAINTIQAIHDKGAYVHLVCEGIRTDSGKGREWIAMFAAIAQLESQIKSQRVREALKVCKANGRPVGLPYYGTKKQKITQHLSKLSIDKKDALQAAQIWVLKHEIQLTHTQIEDMILAIKARELGEPAKLRMVCSRIMIARKLKQIENLKTMMGHYLWNDMLAKARRSLEQPFAPEHLRLIRRWKWSYSNQQQASA